MYLLRSGPGLWNSPRIKHLLRRTSAGGPKFSIHSVQGSPRWSIATCAVGDVNPQRRRGKKTEQLPQLKQPADTSIDKDQPIDRFCGVDGPDAGVSGSLSNINAAARRARKDSLTRTPARSDTHVSPPHELSKVVETVRKGRSSKSQRPPDGAGTANDTSGHAGATSTRTAAAHNSASVNYSGGSNSHDIQETGRKLNRSSERSTEVGSSSHRVRGSPTGHHGSGRGRNDAVAEVLPSKPTSKLIQPENPDLSSWAPVLALLDQRSRLDGPSPVLAVTMLTSQPACAVAAAVSTLANEHPILEACRTGGSLVEAITAAAAAVATAAAAAVVPEDNTKAGIALRVGGQHARSEKEVRGARSRDTDTDDSVDVGTALQSVRKPEGDGQPNLLWPLMPKELMTMVTRSTSSSSSSSNARNGSACGGRGEGGYGAGDDGDRAVVAAAEAVLKEVSRSILNRGVYPVRSVATKLRTSISTAKKTARAAAAAAAPTTGTADGSGDGQRPARTARTGRLPQSSVEALEHMEELLLVPQPILRTVQDGCRFAARQMPGAQVAAVLTALGSLALTLDPEVRGLLATRALKLLEAGLPGQDEKEQESDMVGVGSVGAAPSPSSVPRRPLPPPLAALLMLLLVAVLPQELAHRQVRWLMWKQLRCLLLPPQLQQQRRWSHDAAAAAVDVGMGGDMINAEDGGDGGAAVAVAGGANRRLPLVAVAALLVAGDRLQVLLHASDVEEAAMQRLSRHAHQLTARQLCTLLRCRADKQAILGSDVLARFVARLAAAAATGELDPRVVPSLLEVLADQVYLLERRELSRLTGGLMRAISLAAQRMGFQDNTAATHGSTGQVHYLGELAGICAELELALGRLKLEWADPDLLNAVRDELAGFAASGGAHPEAVIQAWQVLLRSPDYWHMCARFSSSPDEFIEEARRELLSLTANDPERSSVLEAILAVPPAAEGAGESGQATKPLAE